MQKAETCVNGESLDAVLVELGSISNSRERATQMFQWLIHPVPAAHFFRSVSAA